LYDIDNEELTDITISDSYLESLDKTINNDLILDEIYGKERGHRIVFFGIQLDEMWTFVGNKANKQWLWIALNPANRQVIAFHIGSRSGVDAQLFYDKIPDIFKGKSQSHKIGFFSDYYKAYEEAFKNEAHFGVGKDSGLTAYIERFNGTVRQRVSRLVRKALSFSKSLENHIGAIKYFICHYNLTIKTL
jgi:insertion element IS1 protein InsB